MLDDVLGTETDAVRQTAAGRIAGSCRSLEAG